MLRYLLESILERLQVTISSLHTPCLLMMHPREQLDPRKKDSEMFNQHKDETDAYLKANGVADRAPVLKGMASSMGHAAVSPHFTGRTHRGAAEKKKKNMLHPGADARCIQARQGTFAVLLSQLQLAMGEAGGRSSSSAAQRKKTPLRFLN